MLEIFLAEPGLGKNPILWQYSGHIVYPTESSKIYPLNFICDSILIRGGEQLNYIV